jgi:hypothetical protein
MIDALCVGGYSQRFQDLNSWSYSRVLLAYEHLVLKKAPPANIDPATYEPWKPKFTPGGTQTGRFSSSQGFSSKPTDPPPARPSTTQMSDEELPVAKLKKIMGQTTSDNDNVALMAVRMANKFLNDNGWSWDRLLEGKIKVAENPFANLKKPPAQPGRGVPDVPDPPAPPPPPRRPPTYADIEGNTWPTAAEAQASNNRIRQARQAKANPPPKPPPSVFPTIGSQFANKFANSCYCCGQWTDQSLGFIFKPHDILTAQKNPNANNWGKSKWAVVCKPCNNKQNLVLDHRQAPKVGGPASLADLA